MPRHLFLWLLQNGDGGSDFMLATFGWKAALAIFINALIASWIFRKILLGMDDLKDDYEVGRVPPLVMLIHLTTLVLVVIFSHHPFVFVGFIPVFSRFYGSLPSLSKSVDVEGRTAGCIFSGWSGCAGRNAEMVACSYPVQVK